MGSQGGRNQPQRYRQISLWAPLRKINVPIYLGTCWLPPRQAEADDMVEWDNEKLKHLTNGSNKSGVNGQIRFEPCIAAFDRMQTEPLNAVMATITKVNPGLKWKHSWKHLTLQDQDGGDYIAWLALDHLEGIAKTYIDKQHFEARQFENEFNTALGAIMTRKTIGNKGKGKTKGGEGVLSPDDFLKAVGLGNEGKGSYFKVSTLTMKTKVPFTFEVRSITQAEFTTKYTEHLTRIAKRILTWSYRNFAFRHTSGKIETRHSGRQIHTEIHKDKWTLLQLIQLIVAGSVIECFVTEWIVTECQQRWNCLWLFRLLLSQNFGNMRTKFTFGCFQCAGNEFHFCKATGRISYEETQNWRLSSAGDTCKLYWKGDVRRVFLFIFLAQLKTTVGKKQREN